MRSNIKTNIADKLLKDITETILKHGLISNNDRIVIGVSGGPDSMCLLDALFTLKDTFANEYNINYSILVAHVNHMIREESEYEKKYVENFCIERHIPFYYLKENVEQKAKELKMSVEACGRKIRYDFFRKIMKQNGANKIAVAHNFDDNVETILLNIMRGCGLKGLTGMEYFSNQIIRPLLDIEKKDILEYNNIQGLNPCFDKTNEETIYLRNKIRLKLIPNLKDEYNINFSKNLTRMSKILKEDEEFLDEFTNNIVSEAIIQESEKSIEFDFSNEALEKNSIKYRFIRKIIQRKTNSLDGIENIHIMDISKLFENNIKGKKYIIGDKFTIEIISKNIATIY